VISEKWEVARREQGGADRLFLRISFVILARAPSSRERYLRFFFCVFLGGRVGSARMKLFSLLVLVVALVGVSCERHDFEETKKLHEKHGAAHGDEHAGDAH
jgi:hypothetical protein